MEAFSVADNFESLDPQAKDLVGRAQAAAEQAYAPYSGFQVGAAVLLEDGTVVVGSNQENAAFPSGMCAERVALYAATTRYPQSKITSLAVVARHAAGKALVPATPCGSCRQVMLEFEIRQSAPFRVIMKTGQDQWIASPSASALLPFSFQKGALDPPGAHTP